MKLLQLFEEYGLGYEVYLTKTNLEEWFEYYVSEELVQKHNRIMVSEKSHCQKAFEKIFVEASSLVVKNKNKFIARYNLDERLKEYPPQLFDFLCFHYNSEKGFYVDMKPWYELEDLIDKVMRERSSEIEMIWEQTKLEEIFHPEQTYNKTIKNLMKEVRSIEKLVDESIQMNTEEIIRAFEESYKEELRDKARLQR